MLETTEQELQNVVEAALNTPQPGDDQRPPTAKELAFYKKNLKENTELLELEARNWKAQLESLQCRIELTRLQKVLSTPPEPAA